MMEKRDNSNLLSSINVPTLITAGSDDIHIPKASASAMNQGIKGSRFAWIERTAHVSNLENPSQYNKVLDQFFKSR
jgi:pimeloyl-ACP methyl ester carboxylesterase